MTKILVLDSTKIPAGSYDAEIIRNGNSMDTQLQFTEDTTGAEIDRDLTNMYRAPTSCVSLTPVDRPASTVTISQEDYAFVMDLAGEAVHPLTEPVSEPITAYRRRRLAAVKVLGTRSNG